MKKILEYTGRDTWSHPCYKDKEGRKYVDISYPYDYRHPRDLHTVTSDYGEPNCPVHFDEIEVTGWSDEDQFAKEHAYEYAILDATRMRAEDYLRVRESSSKDYALEYLKRSYGRVDPMSFAEDLQKYFDAVPVVPEWLTQDKLDEIKRRLAA